MRPLRLPRRVHFQHFNPLRHRLSLFRSLPSPPQGELNRAPVILPHLLPNGTSTLT